MKDFKTLIYLLILSTFLLSMMALLASAEDGVSVSAKSSALYNPDTKSFIYERNANERLPMASTTKIMTGLIAIEMLDLSEVISVPKEAVGTEGSSLYLKENDELTAKDLIYGVLLQSANDAATVLAMRISGSVADFADLMTKRAEQIGATSTQFKNPHGLDAEEHYTTAHDLSLIAAEALSNKTFKEIVGTYKYSFTLGEQPRTIVNHNKLLKSYDGCIGVKTGYTKKSGRCLVSASKKDGITLVAVTLNDPDDWTDHKNMLDYGYTRLERIDLDSLVKLPASIPTVSSDGASVTVTLAKSSIIKPTSEEINYKINLPYYIVKDTHTGDKIGEISITWGEHEEKIDIVAACDVTIKRTPRDFF